MKAAVLNRPGEPLEISELPDPEPGAGEILVRVEACGVCHSDLHLADGEWKDSLDRRIRPTVLGHEVVGLVEILGSDVSGIETGQRVGVGWVGSACGQCTYCDEGSDNLCERRLITGIDLAGGYAEKIVMKASQAVRVPDNIDPTAAAPLFCAGITVYRGMKKAAIQSGQRVAVFGVGGLGHIGVQLAKMWEAETTAVDLMPDKLDFARSLGADHVTDLAPREIHVAVVTAASRSAYEAAFHSLRKGGTLVVVGLPNEPLSWLADDIATNEIRIVGSAVGPRAEIYELLHLASTGRVTCKTANLPLDKANEALEQLRRGEVTGRLALVP